MIIALVWLTCFATVASMNELSVCPEDIQDHRANQRVQGMDTCTCPFKCEMVLDEIKEFCLSYPDFIKLISYFIISNRLAISSPMFAILHRAILCSRRETPIELFLLSLEFLAYFNCSILNAVFIGVLHTTDKNEWLISRLQGRERSLENWWSPV